MNNIEYAEQRRYMVSEQLEARGIDDQRVLQAMALIRRELFVPEDIRSFSYHDGPLPIDCGQTISQPYIIASMAEFLDIAPDDRVLEVGTGSGYNTALLSHLAREVYTIEIQPALAIEASERLRRLGHKNIIGTVGDGLRGWKAHAPFDKILVTAAISHSPQELLEQLAPKGRLIAPEGEEQQFLYLYEKKMEVSGEIWTEKSMLIPVKFMPAIEQGPDQHGPAPLT